MKTLASSFVVVLQLLSVAQAQQTDDRDLTGGRRYIVRTPQRRADALKPDHVQEGSSVQGLAIQFVRMIKGTAVPVEGLSFKVQLQDNGPWVALKTDAQGVARDPSCSKATINFSIPLVSDKFKLSNGSGNYQLAMTVKCGLEQKFIFDEQSQNGQAIAIWQTVVRAGKRLATTVGTEFWKRPISFVWPADGDYYNFDTVHLTLGHQWDVVAHEMGHAIYDQTKIGGMQGGQHYIDRCYSETLALSEGWASFFSAFVNIDLRDGDAKFEYMVPRRAPIRFENVPSDVCDKSTNEWRVNAWLWDIIDLHDDGETMNEQFARLWNDTIGGRVSSLKAMKARLIQKGWDADRLETLWKLNFPGE